MGPYDEVLQAAAALGFQAPAAVAAVASDEPTHSACSSSAVLQQAQQLVEQCAVLHDLELRLASLSDRMASRDVSDSTRLSGRADAMRGACAALQDVAAAKDALADRLRFASTRPSVPVAPEYQPDFSQLLRCAAGSAGGLHQGMAAVQWAVALDARPGCWEDQLRVIREAAAGLRDALGSMRGFDAALAAAEGGGGGGVHGGA